MMYKKLIRKKHIREDGWLSELVSMNYDDEPFNCVHSYLVSIEPGKTRAKHYHNKKEEWLCICSGKVELILEDIKTKKRETLILNLDSENYNIIYIPLGVAHVIKNISENKASVVIFSKTPEDTDDTFEYEF
ncbi:MAG: hypothetical protein COV98_01650 [Candidatus Altarchaeum sp. CG12_big_fil_rev_8_21_14_0_65_33_22]|nr:MAG: hypothetical protein AUK59_05940 [Candidatus Altarchaeum sp. CG2_30_32_3053]PIN67768.1 MAG: hypothetical protein COV98_01650 [Candidatus Altarchaeum sp. CG12_big_fil_rev_8_21_14_0_65_33_22]PIX48941.1 MAG: hypothetical protein COZ53_02305 [Candidatus Altarchaeum sp. CG_4_8_14_3_um_filter_33_2054]PIZ32390.1 MAG: hypothetical protein COY41_01220 [Candidatus Altarchaeum sp. CG_4_10_14_0_8_um_filter_32_851]